VGAGSRADTVNTAAGGTTGNLVRAGRIDRFEQHLHAAPAAGPADRWVVGTVPPRAGAFQDREVATRLAEASAAHGTTVLIGTGSRVLSGLGGVGKTQLAAEHARTLWESGGVDVLVWVVARVLGKLELRDRTQAAVFAFRQGLAR